MSALSRYGVQNRPSPRLVQVAVIIAIAVPAVVLGIACAAVAEILTVDWPTGGDR